jgi:hypothetical protein
MRALTVRELIAELQTQNPDSPVLRATDSDVPAKPLCEIDKVSIKDLDTPAILLI